MSNVITDVIPHGLCIGCGTCVAICPKNSLIIEVNKKKGLYEPRFIEENCSNCGICLEVCPGLGFIGDQHAEHVNYYISHSNSEDIRYNCSSGGLITQMLIFALEEKIIDGALVTKMKINAPLEPEPFIARTREEILEASKSKYCPVPVNIALKDIINSKKGQKFAIVGLPCHIVGARNAEKINKDLEKKIIFHFGLVCNHTPTFHATHFILDSYKLNSNKIKEIKYRGEGWPSGMNIKCQTGESLYLPQFHPDYWGVVFNTFFVPKRCGLCDDKECRNSDVAFADAWIPEIMLKDRLGCSIIVSRNVTINNLLNKANLKKVITLREVPEDVFLQSQSLSRVKRKAYARYLILNFFRKKTSLWNAPIPRCSFLDYITSIIFIINNYYFSEPCHFGIIRLYCKLVKKGSVAKNHIKSMWQATPPK